MARRGGVHVVNGSPQKIATPVHVWTGKPPTEEQKRKRQLFSEEEEDPDEVFRIAEDMFPEFREFTKDHVPEPKRIFSVVQYSALITIFRWIRGFLAHSLFALLFMIWAFHERRGNIEVIASRQVSTRILESKYGGEPLLPGVNYKDISVIDDIWWWLSNSFIDRLVALHASTEAIQFLGKIRFRQVRVLPQLCDVIPPGMEAISTSCLYAIARSDEQKTAFGPGTAGFTWSSQETLTPSPSRWSGEVAYYEDSGYVVDVPLNSTLIRLVLKELQANTWLDSASRAVFVDWNTYIPNLQLFVVCRLVIEMTASGVLYPTSFFHASRVLKNLGGTDSFMFFLEIAFFIWVLAIFGSAAWQVLRFGFRSHFSDFWNVVEIVNGLLFFAGFIVRISENSASEAVRLSVTDYADLQGVVRASQVHRGITSINCFLTLSTFMRYLGRLPKLDTLMRTLESSGGPFALIAILFGSMAMGFSVLLNVGFGDTVSSTQTLGAAMQFCMGFVRGGSDVAALFRANWPLAFTFVAFLLPFCAWIIGAIFFGAVNHAYRVAVHGCRTAQDPFSNVWELLRTEGFSRREIFATTLTCTFQLEKRVLQDWEDCKDALPDELDAIIKAHEAGGFGHRKFEKSKLTPMQMFKIAELQCKKAVHEMRSRIAEVCVEVGKLRVDLKDVAGRVRELLATMSELQHLFEHPNEEVEEQLELVHAKLDKIGEYLAREASLNLSAIQELSHTTNST